jgi:hypothetical protein
MSYQFLNSPPPGFYASAQGQNGAVLKLVEGRETNHLSLRIQHLTLDPSPRPMRRGSSRLALHDINHGLIPHVATSGPSWSSYRQP